MTCEGSVPIALKKVLSSNYKGSFCIIEELYEYNTIIKKTQKAFISCKKKKSDNDVCKNHISQPKEMYFNILCEKNIYMLKPAQKSNPSNIEYILPSCHQPLELNISDELYSQIKDILEKK